MEWQARAAAPPEVHSYAWSHGLSLTPLQAAGAGALTWGRHLLLMTAPRQTQCSSAVIGIADLGVTSFQKHAGTGMCQELGVQLQSTVVVAMPQPPVAAQRTIGIRRATTMDVSMPTRVANSGDS